MLPNSYCYSLASLTTTLHSNLLLFTKASHLVHHLPHHLPHPLPLELQGCQGHLCKFSHIITSPLVLLHPAKPSRLVDSSANTLKPSLSPSCSCTPIKLPGPSQQTTIWGAILPLTQHTKLPFLSPLDIFIVSIGQCGRDLI